VNFYRSDKIGIAHFENKYPDLPLTPFGDFKVGMGLWNYKMITILLESVIFFCGFYVIPYHAWRKQIRTVPKERADGNSTDFLPTKCFYRNKMAEYFIVPIRTFGW